MAVDVSEVEQLDERQRADVLALAAAVENEVGQPPLSDQALTHLNGTARHLLAAEAGALVGYAQLAGDTVELAAGSAAIDALLDALGPLPAGAGVWAHGTRSALGPALAARGYSAVRTLHQLRRPLQPLPPERPLPAGVEIRTFVPGRDDEPWLALNAAAFAALPDQGGWTIDDLRARQREPWWDPDGFFLAQRTDGNRELLGFHWTKRHGDDLGEVYVLGVHPSAQRLHLGGALLRRGLAYLADRGDRDVLLYVDGSNEAALRLYEGAGFERFDTDVQWAP